MSKVRKFLVPVTIAAASLVSVNSSANTSDENAVTEQSTQQVFVSQTKAPESNPLQSLILKSSATAIMLAAHYSHRSHSSHSSHRSHSSHYSGY